jgi:hypothetical protein
LVAGPFHARRVPGRQRGPYSRRLAAMRGRAMMPRSRLGGAAVPALNLRSFPNGVGT